jgi:hypothetical protein
VCGNCPSLGGGDPSRAIQLVTSSTDFPWWQSNEGELLMLVNNLFLVLSIFYLFCLFTQGYLFPVRSARSSIDIVSSPEASSSAGKATAS